MVQRSILVLAMTMLAAPAVAQDGTNTWSDVSMSDLRSRVMVLDEAGAEWSGEPLRLDADGLALILASGQERHFPVAQIRRLETTRRDSLKSGTLIGAGVGLVAGLALSGGGVDVAVIPVATAFYGVIGMTVDFLVPGERQTTIYEASGTTFAERHGVGAREPHTSRALNLSISW